LADVRDYSGGTDVDKRLIRIVLNMNGYCEYCEKNKATTMDHFNALVNDRLPTDACNDFWNLVPCCNSCNSSKGGQTIEKWIDGDSDKNPFHFMNDEDRNRIVTKLRYFRVISDKRRYKKIFDKEKVIALLTLVDHMMFQIQVIVNIIHQMTVYVRE
jgi:hypothetical protein